MINIFRCLAVLLVVSALAIPAAAQLTVATDRTTYMVGDVVSITIHNAGPGAVMFGSFPACTILHIESGECLDGCIGLPEIWWLQPGETILTGRDTAVLPDPPGHYQIELVGRSGVPGSILSTEYLLTAVISSEATTWGAVKSLYGR